MLILSMLILSTPNLVDADSIDIDSSMLARACWFVRAGPPARRSVRADFRWRLADTLRFGRR